LVTRHIPVLAQILGLAVVFCYKILNIKHIHYWVVCVTPLSAIFPLYILNFSFIGGGNRLTPMRGFKYVHLNCFRISIDNSYY